MMYDDAFEDEDNQHLIHWFVTVVFTSLSMVRYQVS